MTNTPAAPNPAPGHPGGGSRPPASPALTDTPTHASSVLSTLNDDGSRRWLKPRASPGRFLRSRRVVAWTLIVVFTALPYLKVHGAPVILLDIVRRRFTILGKTFLPTDMLLLALLLLTAGVTVFLATALLGRVWCGWACPQTVYMEFLYRPIERLFEGSPGRAKKGWLQTSGAGAGLKYVVYLGASLFLAHTFLSYFVGVEQLRHWITQSPARHPVGFAVVVFVTALMMFDFCLFREQTCIVVCPYGRFQSVMLDRQSLVISYDYRRGEPRGKAAKRADVALPVVGASAPRTGDCVDCRLCVTTCPTGIDIRNGLQMECVNCAQCIDACDAVMEKLNRPRGLIRYSSQAAIVGEKRRFVRPRAFAYSAILCVLVGAFLFVLSTKGAADVIILRGLGAPFAMISPEVVGNPVRVKLVNRREIPQDYSVEAIGPEGLMIRLERDAHAVPPTEPLVIPGMVEAPLSAFSLGKLDIRIRVTDSTGFSRELPYRLMGPGTGHVVGGTP